MSHTKILRLHSFYRLALGTLLAIGAASAHPASPRSLENEPIIICVDCGRRELLTPACQEEIRAVCQKGRPAECRMINTGERECRDDAARSGGWYAVGAGSCRAPFSSLIEQVDCRTWQLRQRYVQAKSRYKARTSISAGTRIEPWVD